MAVLPVRMLIDCLRTRNAVEPAVDFKFLSSFAMQLHVFIFYVSLGDNGHKLSHYSVMAGNRLRRVWSIAMLLLKSHWQYQCSGSSLASLYFRIHSASYICKPNLSASWAMARALGNHCGILDLEFLYFGIRHIGQMGHISPIYWPIMQVTRNRWKTLLDQRPRAFRSPTVSNAGEIYRVIRGEGAYFVAASSVAAPALDSFPDAADTGSDTVSAAAVHRNTTRNAPSSSPSADCRATRMLSPS